LNNKNDVGKVFTRTLIGGDVKDEEANEAGSIEGLLLVSSEYLNSTNVSDKKNEDDCTTGITFNNTLFIFPS